VEQEGEVFALKMALRPASEEVPPGDEDIDGRMGHEAAFHLSNEALSGVLRVVEVTRWPRTRDGYRVIVSEYEEGETFHDWRWRTRPSAAKLLDVYAGLVRTVNELHRRGIYHRDIKAGNVLIRTQDEKPFLIDFGVVSLPGASPLTVGVPAGTLHVLPPEALAFVRSEAWRQGARFRGGAAADLYALGVLLYEALVDCHPFDPLLPAEQLITAIETRMPPAPHELNPGVPPALSRIAMHLLAKTPADRIPSAEALLQALWDAKKDSRARAWQVPLPMPPEGTGRLRQKTAAQEAEHESLEEELAPAAPLEEQPHEARAQEEKPMGLRLKAHAVLNLLWAFTPRRVRWGVALAVSLLLALGLMWATLAPPPQEGSASMPTRDSWLSRPLVLLCTLAGLGCPGAQVKPPPSGEDCPEEAERVMFEELQLTEGSPLRALVDVNQPGEMSQRGTYREGPVTGLITYGEGGLPEGTLLQGRLWTGPGIYTDSRPPKEAVIARYTSARLPDGRVVPVCIVLGGPDGRVPKSKGSTAEAVLLGRELPASPVRIWP
jgi:serine/threonine-protein kinase